MIVVAIILATANYFRPFDPISNCMLFTVIIVLGVLYRRKRLKETYDYDQENPNALITGKNIAGTVYASDPDNVPGLGWIL